MTHLNDASKISFFSSFQSVLHAHIKSKHNLEGLSRLLDCDLCDKSFKTRAVLLNHRREQHELSDSARRVKCHICGFEAKGVRNLGKHLRSHEDWKPFQCHVCSKMFRVRGNLNVHMKVHEPVARHECALCDVSFKLPHHLKTHYKSATHRHAVSEEAREAALRARMTDMDVSEQRLAGVAIGLENGLMQHPDLTGEVTLDGNQNVLPGFETFIPALNTL